MMKIEDVRTAVTAVVEQMMADNPTVPGVSVAIDHPALGTHCIVRGVADPATGEPLTGEHAVRIASCTKPFVACTVLRLAGQGRLELDQPAAAFLPADVVASFARFEHAPATTVRHLLQHRSGLVDHSSFPEFHDTTTRWTPLAQIDIATGKPALFAPDAAFSYSDTGYVILGQIVEHVTGTSLAAAVRTELALDPTRYPSIHWEVAEPTPIGLRRAHQLHDGDDTYDWDPSMDLFGGGGIVADMADLARWWTALFAGRVHPHLAEQLADPRPTVGPDGIAWPSNDEVGLGLFRRVVGGHELWAHGGYWGLQTLHVADLQASIALVITAKAAGIPGPAELADQVVLALAALSSRP